MAFRLIEVFLNSTDEKHAADILKEKAGIEIWHERLSEDLILIRVLVESERAEEILDLLENSFSGTEGFRIILLPVEASIPRPAPPPEAAPAENVEPVSEQEKQQDAKKERISREELYTDIEETIKLSWVFVVLIVLSAIVAAIGILRSNVAIIIGAMVIAPLLGPNVALSLATTLGDIALARRALKANVLGIIIALLFSIFLGFFLEVTPDMSVIASKTRINLEDIVLALAAGSAAALSFTTGLSSALIGVMVAVALLPPLVTFGLLLGAGYVKAALNALLLVLTNIVCINLSGVTTFLVQGIQPRTWWEADRAKKATRNAIFLWVLLLVVLAGVIYLSRRVW